MFLHLGVTAKNINWRYLATPAKKQKAERRRRQLSDCQRRIRKLEEHISSLVESNTSCLQEEELHEELENIVEEHDHKMCQLKQDDIKRIFWNQQVCTYIITELPTNHSISHKYTKDNYYGFFVCTLFIQKKASQVKGPGVLELPSTRTLRDYTNHIKTHPGTYYIYIIYKQ